MRSRISRDQRMLDLIDLIYQVEDRDQMLGAVFSELRNLFSFSSGVLLPIDPERLELDSAVCFECPTENTAPYLEHYAAFDPFVRRHPSLLIPNRTARLSDVASPADLDHSVFSDFLASVPYRHALGAVAAFNGQMVAAFGLHRQRNAPDFGAEEMALIDRLMPHLGRALAMRKWLGEPDQSDEVALLACREDEHVLFMNQAARRLLSPKDVGNLLAAMAPAGPGILQHGRRRYRVRRIPWRASSLLTPLALCGREVESRSDEGLPATRQEWTRIQQLAARLILITISPFRRRRDVQARLAFHGLSPREVEIATHSLLSGLGNGDLARKLCVSEETVKSHLREVYRRVGVNSRHELFVKILGLQDDPGSYPGEKTRP